MLAGLESPAARRAWRWLLALMLLACSWLALVGAPPPSADLGWDKLNHLVAFGCLTAVALQAWPGARWAVAVALLGYGAGLELAQSILPPRVGEWPDLAADAVGVALGLPAGALLTRGLHWLAGRRLAVD